MLTRGGPGTAPFRAEFVIDVQGQRLSWTRETSLVKVPMTGSFDSKNGFRVEGLGTRSDDNDTWRERASGRYDPKTQRIEGRGQLLTMRDLVIARECTLVAARGAAPPMLALPPAPQAPAGRWAAKLACEASRNPKTTGARALPFTGNAVVEIAGQRLIWTRGDDSFKETASGSFDAKVDGKASGTSRFSIEGMGSDRNNNQWRLRASGSYDPTTRLLQAQANQLRPDDNFVTRDCTIRARLGGLEPLP